MTANYDLIVIGGGPAGLAAAYEAYKNDIKNILILERSDSLGGVLNQCIHSGFGLHIFKEELTGPEYASKFIDIIKFTNINIKLNTTVLSINKNKIVCAVNSKDGYMELNSKAIILAMGCRERTRGAIGLAGSRPSGIYTAGTAQYFMNIEGCLPGKDVLILGSGDIGLIMARRLTLEGAKVHAVIGTSSYSKGLKRNIVQCLNDYNIPMILSHTVVDVIGNQRLEKVIVAKVDKNRRPIKNTEKEFIVDTLLLSVGLIPENDISFKAGIQGDFRTSGLIVNESMETSVEGIFACGNVLHVHDIVDFVTLEAQQAGIAAAKFIKNELKHDKYLNIKNSDGISYTVPQKIDVNCVKDFLTVCMRSKNIYKDKSIIVKTKDKIISKFKRDNIAPSEMQKILLSKSLLKGLDSDLIVSVED